MGFRRVPHASRPLDVWDSTTARAGDFELLFFILGPLFHVINCHIMKPCP